MSVFRSLRRQAVRIALSFALTAAFLSIAAGAWSPRFVQQLEYLAYDARLALTMPGTVDDRIVIIDIDEQSLSREGHWPWHRDKLKALVDNAFDTYGAAVMGFDVVFAEPDSDLPLSRVRQSIEQSGGVLRREDFERLHARLDRDAQFADSLRGRPAVLGYYFNIDPDKHWTQGELPAPVFKAEDFAGTLVRFYGASGYGANLAVLQDAAATGGHFDNPVTDADGVFRRIAMLREYDGGVYESLSLAVTRLYLNERLEPVFARGLGASGDYPSMEWLRIGKLKIPVDGRAAALVPYRGPSGSFPYVSASKILRGELDDPDALRGRIVLVGTSAPGLLDMRSTPVQNVFPGVEIHANVISGILDGRLMQSPAWVQGAEFVILLVLGVVLSIALPMLSAVWAAIISLSAAAAVVVVNLAAWVQAGLVLPIATSLLLVVGLFTLNMSYGYLIEARGKRQLGRLFGQYVPPELVDEMSRDPQHYNLQGERREMTVLFSDVRGFTGISEGLDPQELTALMNEFLTPMTHIIHRHRGTIDKYMGDAIMAFWGAPLLDRDHARHALDAAVDMEREVGRLDEMFKHRGWPPLRIGVGLNTGVMNVGNMGSEFRMAYTVLGDAVNLGSRLEGLTKRYGVTVIVSEFTRQVVSGFVFRELDRVRVKGKDEPVAIFEPVGPEAEVDTATRDELERYHEALGLYRAQRWDAAEREFQVLYRDMTFRPLYKLYLDRIATFKEEPPGESWDGVFVYETK